MRERSAVVPIRNAQIPVRVRRAMAAPLGHALAVRVEEGRHFPRDAGAAFRVAATFDDEPRSTVRRQRSSVCRHAGSLLPASRPAHAPPRPHAARRQPALTAAHTPRLRRFPRRPAAVFATWHDALLGEHAVLGSGPRPTAPRVRDRHWAAEADRRVRRRARVPHCCLFCACTACEAQALTRSCFAHAPRVALSPRRAVFDAEGAKFGWLVLDLRAAKLNAAPGGAYILHTRALFLAHARPVFKF
jgi:hypothetical protein